MTTAGKLTYIKANHETQPNCDSCRLILGLTCPRKPWGDWTEKEISMAYNILHGNNDEIKPDDDEIEFVKVTHEEAEAEARYDTHKKLCASLNDTYRKKNADYGDSFGKGFAEYGMMMPVIRLEDKFLRFKRLALSGKQNVKDESIKDTLLDLANYALMTIVEMEANNG